MTSGETRTAAVGSTKVAEAPVGAAGELMRLSQVLTAGTRIGAELSATEEAEGTAEEPEEREEWKEEGVEEETDCEGVADVEGPVVDGVIGLQWVAFVSWRSGSSSTLKELWRGTELSAVAAGDEIEQVTAEDLETHDPETSAEGEKRTGEERTGAGAQTTCRGLRREESSRARNSQKKERSRS